MRLAVLADVHGNSVALDVVLEDINSGGGVDAYLVLGDLAAMGPDPVGVLQRLTALRGAQFGDTARNEKHTISLANLVSTAQSNR